MHDLLIINGVSFPTPEGSFEIKYEDKTNEYEGESGKKTIEIIRQNIAKISVAYNGMFETEIDRLNGILRTVNNVTFYKKGTKVTVEMKLSDISTPKKYYRNGLSVWGMSFSLEEL